MLRCALVTGCRVCAGNIPWGELVGPQIKMELVERKGVLKVSEKVKNPFNVLLHYGLSSEPDDRNLTVEQFRDIMAQIVMVSSSVSPTSSSHLCHTTCHSKDVIVLCSVY